MINIKRLTVLAVLVLVVTRIAIGWHFFYEGLWKFRTVGTANEWSAAPFLRNSRGPFRENFRALIDDPDDLNWLDHEWVDTRWKAWQEKFVAFHELTKEQQQQLSDKLDGPKEFVGKERILGDPQKNPYVAGKLGRKLIGGALERNKIIQLRIDSKRRWYLVVKGDQHLIPQERDRLLRDARKIEQDYRREAKQFTGEKAEQAEAQANLVRDFQKALKDVDRRNARLSFRERLAVLLKGDSKRVTQIDKDQPEESVDHRRPGETDQYRDRVVRYNAMLTSAKQNFQHEHLQRQAQHIRTLHTKLVGPVKGLEYEMLQAARSLLTETQREKGEVPIAPPTRIDRVNQATMWGLMVIGMMLIVGFFSRLSALAGGLLVLSFYLAMPPWPGVPPAPGPEHTLFINKNAVEVLALFALALIPTGKFFGIDAFFIGLFGSRASRSAAASPATASSQRTGSALNSPAEQSAPADTPSTTAAVTVSKSTYPVRPPEKKR
ncbi:MAG: hypothetical protein ACE5KM_12350 [Planctomycetaceae bacterium]